MEVEAEGFPDLCTLAPSLAELLGVQQATRAHCLHALWRYVQANKLQARYPTQYPPQYVHHCGRCLCGMHCLSAGGGLACGAAGIAHNLWSCSYPHTCMLYP